MKRDRFEKQFNISTDALSFKPENGYEYAVVGRFTVFHYLESDSYEVAQDNSVCQFRYDLSREI